MYKITVCYVSNIAFPGKRLQSGLLASGGRRQHVLHRSPHRKYKNRNKAESCNEKMPELSTLKIPYAVLVFLYAKKRREYAGANRQKTDFSICQLFIFRRGWRITPGRRMGLSHSRKTGYVSNNLTWTEY